MAQYIHPDLPDFRSPAPFKLGEGDEQISYARGWWNKASELEIADLGFVEYVEPEPEPATLEGLRAAKLAALANRRWQAETGGVDFNGSIIRSDAVSQAKITGAVSLFASDPTLAYIDWEATPGEWVMLDAITMTAIGVAVGRHVQACFSNAKTLGTAILAAEDQSALDAVDIDAGWPA